jgi:cephalosporin hydroxylase
MENLKGHTTYHPKTVKNLPLTSQQRPYAFTAFESLLKQVRPSQILEIGTAGGGTIMCIREHLNSIGLESTEIMSFEVREQKWYPKMREAGINVVIDNIFSKSYRHLSKPDIAKNFIQKEGTTLVLCDGGSKINEFNLLSDFLKIGDIIMAHDYIDTRENFLQNYKDKIWNWREIGDEHINPPSQRNGLTPFLKEVFDPAVWACRKKTQ